MNKTAITWLFIIYYFQLRHERQQNTILFQYYLYNNHR